MSKKLFLSNSQINTYTDCARKWYLDKQKRLRPNWKGSALIFGSALDAAVESILLKSEIPAEIVFAGALRAFEVNGVEKHLPEDLLDVRFFAGDVDVSLFEAKDLDKVGAFCDGIEIDMPELDEFLLFCKQQRKSKTALTKTEQKLFNFLAYRTMQIKGLMMLEKLREWIEENVAEVHEVQKKISIENENGDQFIGFLDFIVTMKTDCETCDGDGLIDMEVGVMDICPDCTPKRVLIDLKTSSNTNAYYPSDSAAESRQLGIYSQEEAIPDVAYLVADKKIRKREPRVRLAFIEGVITEEHLDDVFEEIEEVTGEIKEKLELGEGAFEKNLDSCMKFGGCQYFNFCKKGDMKGLCYIKDKK